MNATSAFYCTLFVLWPMSSMMAHCFKRFVTKIVLSALAGTEYFVVVVACHSLGMMGPRSKM